MFVIRHRIDERENGLSSQVKNIIKKKKECIKFIYGMREKKRLSPLSQPLCTFDKSL